MLSQKLHTRSVNKIIWSVFLLRKNLVIFGISKFDREFIKLSVSYLKKFFFGPIKF